MTAFLQLILPAEADAKFAPWGSQGSAGPQTIKVGFCHFENRILPLTPGAANCVPLPAIALQQNFGETVYDTSKSLSAIW